MGLQIYTRPTENVAFYCHILQKGTIVGSGNIYFFNQCFINAKSKNINHKWSSTHFLHVLNPLEM